MGAIPSNLRRMNERTIVNLLGRMGLASRAELAKAAGISQPTAGKITQELLRLGIVQEVDEETQSEDPAIAGRIGRPGRLLRLNSDHPRFLVIQMGVAQTSLALLAVAVADDDHWSHAFDTPASAEEWIKRVQVTIGPIDAEQLWGVLISVPGIVDEQEGKVLFSPNLHWTERVNLPELVQAVWPVPVLLVQEIRALALGHLAAEPHGEDFLLVDFGQGVGGAIVQHGKLFDSTLPLSGELGHTTVIGNSRACGCGAVGCVETLISRRGLLQSFAASGVAGPTTWPALSHYLAENAMPHWLERSLDAASAIIAGALNVLGLKRAVITGSLTELPPGVIEHLAKGVKQGAMWARFGEVACQSAQRRRAMGLVGVGVDRLLIPDTTRHSFAGTNHSHQIASFRK